MWEGIEKAFKDNPDPKAKWKPSMKRVSVTQILSWPEGVAPVAEYLLRTTIGARQRPTPNSSRAATPEEEEMPKDRYIDDAELEEIYAVFRDFMGLDEPTGT